MNSASQELQAYTDTNTNYKDRRHIEVSQGMARLQYFLTFYAFM